MHGDSDFSGIWALSHSKAKRIVSWRKINGLCLQNKHITYVQNDVQVEDLTAGLSSYTQFQKMNTSGK